MTSSRDLRPRTILRIHFHPAERSEDLYRQLLAVVDGISSRVEPLPADWSAYVDLTGALTYWGRDAEGLVAVLRLRLLALHGVQCSAGAGPGRSIAAMIADATPPGAATVVRDDPYEIAAFLRHKPASALPGIGPKTARTLARYGISTIGDIADTQLPTLQRILGTTAARLAHERAHGVDERPVVPGAAPRTMSAAHRFDRDGLDTDRHNRAVLGLVQDLGGRLRTSGEIAQALTLTVTYADRTQTTRTRTLTEPTAHTPALIAEAARRGWDTTVVATPAAERFLPPLPVPVHTDPDWHTSARPLHLALPENSDAVLIAPATATTLAHCAAGTGQTLLTAIVLGCERVHFWPSMNIRMWNAPAVRRNVAQLQADGHTILDPDATDTLSDPDRATGVGPVPGTALHRLHASLAAVNRASHRA
ncbi:flavoprotein [Streptomyces sp. NPDC089173]|uniref:flavoprotein n=1 Tax=Streptomyces sp. NPDC089173 TaxID=3154965 RepID=UPI00344DFEAD